MSPDCRWAVVSVGDEDIEAGKKATSFRLAKLNLSSQYRAFVVERVSGRIVYHFTIESGARKRSARKRSAGILWLKDNRLLIVIYFESNGIICPLLFTLKPAAPSEPVDLSAHIWLSGFYHSQVATSGHMPSIAGPTMIMSTSPKIPTIALSVRQNPGLREMA